MINSEFPHYYGYLSELVLKRWITGHNNVWRAEELGTNEKFLRKAGSSSAWRRSNYKMEKMSDESEPSYTIVNKQLQDVIRFQHTAIARMKAKVREIKLLQ